MSIVQYSAQSNTLLAQDKPMLGRIPLALQRNVISSRILTFDPSTVQSYTNSKFQDSAGDDGAGFLVCKRIKIYVPDCVEGPGGIRCFFSTIIRFGQQSATSIDNSTLQTKIIFDGQDSQIEEELIVDAANESPVRVINFIVNKTSPTTNAWVNIDLMGSWTYTGTPGGGENFQRIEWVFGKRQANIDDVENTRPSYIAGLS